MTQIPPPPPPFLPREIGFPELPLGPPLPPPIPGFSRAPVVEKTPFMKSYEKLPQPENKLKTIYFGRVASEESKESVFEGMILDVEMDECLNKIGNMFVQKQKVKTVEKVEKVKRIIDGKDAQMIEILFKNFSKTYKGTEKVEEVIIKAVDTMDITVLKQSNFIDELHRLCVPNEDDPIINELKEKLNAKEELDKLDSFYYNLVNIDHCEDKLNVMKIALEIEDNFKLIEPIAKHFVKLAEDIMNSKKIKEIIHIIFVVLNYMSKYRKPNQPIYCFKIDTILKLNTIRAEKQSLLDVIIEYVREKFPDLLNWIEEVPLLYEKNVFLLCKIFLSSTCVPITL